MPVFETKFRVVAVQSEVDFIVVWDGGKVRGKAGQYLANVYGLLNVLDAEKIVASSLVEPKDSWEMQEEERLKTALKRGKC